MIDEQYEEFLKYSVVIAVILMLSVSITYGYVNYVDTEMDADVDIEYDCSASWGTYNATVTFNSISDDVDQVYVFYAGESRTQKYDADSVTTIDIENVRQSEIKVMAENKLTNRQVVHQEQAGEGIECDPYNPSVS